MKIDLVSLVKNCNIFSSLDDIELKKLFKYFEKIHLQKNEILFRQGELSNGVYLLISGRLSITLKRDHNETKIITEVLPGETTGESSALSHEPRSVTVKAAENSILFKLSSEIFSALLQKYPAVFQATINTLVARSNELIQQLSSESPAKKSIVIIPANQKHSLKKFAKKLSELMQNATGITLLSDYDTALNEKYNTLSALQKLIKSIEETNGVILYFLASHKTLLAKICFEKVDMIYVAASSDSKPYINRFVLEKINNNKSSYKIKPELILLHEQAKHLPQRTSAWFKRIQFNLHHHIRINHEQDCQRILRFIRGQAVGLVLGGGGVRGWAHIGVIKALMEANIPIDAIGGTSGGAIVAGYYALHETYEDPHGELAGLAEITRKANSLSNLTYPAISLFNSKDYTQKQMNIYGNVRIRNLWLPYFSVACNLSRNIQVINRSGYLWKAIRSSTAVPAIFPPVIIKGELHLDGGILNNLPVDIMQKLTRGIGTTIAVELTHYNKDTTTYNFPTILNFWPTMLAKLRLAHKDYKFPHFVETFLKSLLAGSSAKQAENGLTADILIKPDLSKFSMLNANKQQAHELIELGYTATMQAIKKWQKEKTQE